MYTSVVEELPLLRAKGVGGLYASATGEGVGPGSYEIDSGRGRSNNSYAPFNTTGLRPPLSKSDPNVPGPGSYTTPSVEVGRGVASCPFVSGTSRFPHGPPSDAPGPGWYDTSGCGATKKNVRSHCFTGCGDRALPLTDGTALGPGFYQPNFCAASRSKPRAAHFSKYSSRTDKKLSDTPGPGAYNINEIPKSLYTSKPSSMFTTNVPRGAQAKHDGPGPGSYDVSSLFSKGRPTETFSAFGSSSLRFQLTDGAERPGPGSYTGEIAPRRARPAIGRGTCSFVGTTNRFSGPSDYIPGPGAYDSNRLPKHQWFGAEAPFGTTVPRFHTLTGRTTTASEPSFSHTAPLRIPRRTAATRSFCDRDISPSVAAKSMPDRSYDVKYDWPKPTSTTGRTFGEASRFPETHTTTAAPGPGKYFADESSAGPQGARFKNSTWERSVRFNHTPLSGNPGPGAYHHHGTLLRKTFNATIGSDTYLVD